ncbi:hypothetical protein BDZ97DRAFT_260923 [Flammula alnicola]|nr:hypothetical protein BDZ97DRAFT_260923 [Flammula alnicola]
MEITISNTFGALEIGSSVAGFLFGVVTLQCYLYFSRFDDDRLAFKALVATVWLLELGQTVAVLYEVYRSTILLYGRPYGAVKFPGFGGATILGGLITALVQWFFSYRLWSVLPSPWRYVGLMCALAAFARAVMCIYDGIEVIVLPSAFAFALDTQPLTTALFVMGASIDVTIAISMVYFLTHKREKSLNRVTKLIDRLIGFSIRELHVDLHRYIYILTGTYHSLMHLGTGLVTSIAAVSVLILYRTMPVNFIYLGAYLPLAKLYSNSLLSALNARSSLRDTVSKSLSVEVPRIGTHRATSSKGLSPDREAYNNVISIEMKTTTQVKADSTDYWS